MSKISLSSGQTQTNGQVRPRGRDLNHTLVPDLPVAAATEGAVGDDAELLRAGQGPFGPVWRQQSGL
jgi:hypothetical protein